MSSGRSSLLSAPGVRCRQSAMYDVSVFCLWTRREISIFYCKTWMIKFFCMNLFNCSGSTSWGAGEDPARFPGE